MLNEQPPHSYSPVEGMPHDPDSTQRIALENLALQSQPLAEYVPGAGNVVGESMVSHKVNQVVRGTSPNGRPIYERNFTQILTPPNAQQAAAIAIRRYDQLGRGQGAQHQTFGPRIADSQEPQLQQPAAISAGLAGRAEGLDDVELWAADPLGHEAERQNPQAALGRRPPPRPRLAGR